MSFFDNINASPIDRLKNKIEHVKSDGVFDIQKADDSLIITYAPTRYMSRCISRIELPYNWLIDKILGEKLDINNIDKILYRSMLSLGEKNNQFINDIHLTFYVRDKIVGTILLSQQLIKT